MQFDQGMMAMPSQWPVQPPALGGRRLVRKHLGLFGDHAKKGDQLRQSEMCFRPRDAGVKQQILVDLEKAHQTRQSLLATGDGRPRTPAHASSPFIQRKRRGSKENDFKDSNSLVVLADESNVHKQHLVTIERDAKVATSAQTNDDLGETPLGDGNGECESCADVPCGKALDSTSWWSALSHAEVAVEREWKLKLTPMQFKVLRLKATEPINTGPLLNCFAAGSYICAGCSQPLYGDVHKISTTCGWPAFKDSIPNALCREQGKKIPEITCSSCGGHLGHVFKSDRYPAPHHERHCVNSASLTFVPTCAEASAPLDGPAFGNVRERLLAQMAAKVQSGSLESLVHSIFAEATEATDK